ncbi:MAG: Na+/H+ antiporter NhaC family protein [Clostridia bacterium]|nr:Na+/H+ antiporter NhaC family protein [Clostridia bacterium]
MDSDFFNSAIENNPDHKEHSEIAIKEIQTQTTPFYGTIWGLLPPVIAILLALITKEVYSSLFVGIVAGGLLYANFNLETAYNTIVVDGFIGSLSDSWNVGIIVFLVVLGAFVALMNKAGGSAAYGRWAVKNIKSQKGALLSTFGLGCLIFIDDYFNCLTVGSVMRPVTDNHRISRAKLAYIIDATAAPICMIAPISSWAAAVSGFAPENQGIQLFCQAIPYNFYSLLTIVMIIVGTIIGLDYGPMSKHEENAAKGDLFTSGTINKNEGYTPNPKGKVIDLVLPVVILIACCVIGMIYTGGFFSGESFIKSFSNSDASVGLSLGSIVALLVVFVYYLCRRLFTLKTFMETLPEGFKAMVPAILILTFAWTLCSMTSMLGAKFFVSGVISGAASELQNILPAIIFLIATGLAFATGTSWGTFGILIPIVVSAGFAPELQTIAMSACLAGAVCGDHCSPISDTTIMASAGAQSDHINHVNTQLPYALTVAAVSFVSYIIAGFVQNVFIALPIAIVLMIAVLFGIKALTAKKA